MLQVYKTHEHRLIHIHIYVCTTNKIQSNHIKVLYINI